MARKRWTVLIDWADGDFEDSDEVVVMAGSASEAVKAAVEEWGRAAASMYPHCIMLDAVVLTRQVIEGFA
jgi:hypothetical protein